MILRLFARRYIAGTERKSAIERAASLENDGLLSAIDNLGENAASPKSADEAVNEYISLLREIRGASLKSSISLKLSHLGLDISEDLAQKNLEKILKESAALSIPVRIDMEGSRYTQRILEACIKAHRIYPLAGVALQCYLKRSADDARTLAKEGISVRLVKGAYKEPPDIAYADKKDVDAAYEELMKYLLLNGSRPAIATHDERLLEKTVQFAREKNIAKNAFDFEMLLGIKRKVQKRLAGEGYTVRVYVPYGRDWLPYTLRRFRERKENIWFVLKNIFD